MQYSIYKWAFYASAFAHDVKDAVTSAGLRLGEIDTMHGWPNGYISRCVNLKPGQRISIKRFEQICNTFDLDPRDYWMITK
jgi:hypothetical protein